MDLISLSIEYAMNYTDRMLLFQTQLGLNTTPPHPALVTEVKESSMPWLELTSNKLYKGR